MLSAVFELFVDCCSVHYFLNLLLMSEIDASTFSVQPVTLLLSVGI